MEFLNSLFALLASILGFATAVVPLVCVLIEKHKEHEKSEPPKAE